MTTYEVTVKGVTLKMYLKEEADARIAELEKGVRDYIDASERGVKLSDEIVAFSELKRLLKPKENEEEKT